MMILIAPRTGHTYSMAIHGCDIVTTKKFVSYMMDWQYDHDSLLLKHKINKPFWQSSQSRHKYCDIKDGYYELFEFLNQGEDLQFQNKLLKLGLELADRLNIDLTIE
jgi:hypothetical protein